MGKTARVRRMLEVKSEMIHKLGFDPNTPGVEAGYLVIQFTNFKAYAYQNVAWSDYLQLLNAPSIGSAFHLLIKDKYEGELITPKDETAVTPTELSKSEWSDGKFSNEPKSGDEIPMLDVMGVDSSAKVGKVSSVTWKKKK